MKKMKTYRKNAIIVGVLFILADVMLFAGEAFYKPILGSPDYLDNAYPNKLMIAIGVLLEFVGYIGLVLIPILLFPILKRFNVVLALAYISFRLFEVVLLSIAQVNKLSLINLSENYLNTDGADTSCFQKIGDAIQSQTYWINSDGLIYILIFVVGGLLFYSALYQSKLLPRWISIWGLLADVALLAASLTATFTDVSLTVAIALVLPIALQEIAMAIWLIAKGFNPSVLDSEYV